MSHSTLVVEQVRGKSVVVDARSEAPLRLLNPANDGPAAWVYLSSLGGGFVGADALRLEVEVRKGATLLLASQSSSKVYREARSSFALKANVGAEATLVVWPDPVTCFSGAALKQVQRVELQPSASLLFVDAFTSGRTARGERWAFESLESRLSIDVDGQPFLREGLWLSRAHGALIDRMHGVDAFANVVVAGPRFLTLTTTLLEAMKSRSQREPVLVTASARPNGAHLRLLAPTVESLLVELQQLLGGVLGEQLGDRPLGARHGCVETWMSRQSVGTGTAGD